MLFAALCIKYLINRFLACTAERFFRIDRAQEQLHYVTDVAVEAVYILEEDAAQQSESQVITDQEKETAQTHSRYAVSHDELTACGHKDCSCHFYRI